MHKIRITTKFLASLFLILMIWGSFYLTSIILQLHNNDNHNYIPQDASFAVRIDGRKLISKSLCSVLFHEDEEIVNLLRDGFEDKEGDESKRLGIAFNSDIILFSQSIEGRDYFGVLLNLTSHRSFKSNISELLNDNEVFASNRNVGLILSEQRKAKQKRLPQEELQLRANKIIEQRSQFDITKLSTSDEDIITQVYLTQGIMKKGHFSNANINFKIKDSELELSGQFVFDRQSKDGYELEPKGFHMDVNPIPMAMNDSLSEFFGKLNIPKIAASSINYYGVEIIQEPVLFVGPRFDAIFSFEEEIEFEQLLQHNVDSNKIERKGKRQISYSGLDLYYDQIDSKTIYIGVSEHYKHAKSTSDGILHIAGDPTALTHLDGEGFIRAVFEASPLYNSSKNFTHRIESLDIKITRNKNGDSDLHGTIRFKKDQYALNSVIKLLLEGNFL